MAIAIAGALATGEARVIQYARPPLYPAQEAAIFCEQRYGIVEASTKAGKTHGCLAWALEKTINLRPGQSGWWVAPVYQQAKIAYRRALRAMRSGLPSWAFRPNETELFIELAGAGTLWFKSAEKPDNLYGDDVYFAVMDEASRTREESWHAVRSTLTKTRGMARIIGNVKGRKNWAYRLARKAQGGEPGYHYSKLTAYDAVQAGILAPEEVEDARRQLPDSVFRELYLAEPSDDAGNPFGLDAIRKRLIPQLVDGPPAVIGCDLAKSIDWTVILGLTQGGSTCAFDRFQLPWEATLKRIESSLSAAPRARMLVDSTGVGDPIVEQLERKFPGRVKGYKFTSPSKQQLMEGLATAIQQSQVSYWAGPGDVIVSELEAFEYAYTRTGVQYSAPDGAHDDTVIALALAVAALRKPTGLEGLSQIGSLETGLWR